MFLVPAGSSRCGTRPAGFDGGRRGRQGRRADGCAFRQADGGREDYRHEQKDGWHEAATKGSYVLLKGNDFRELSLRRACL